MKNISAEVSIFCLWTNWIHLITCSKIEFRELHCYSRCALDKILKLTLSITVRRGGLAKNDFWLVAKQKKRIGEQLNCFWNMCPKPFTWAKNKRKLFSDGKSWGPLLTGAALKIRGATIWTLFFPNLFTLYRYLFTSFVMWSKNIPKTASTMHLNYKLCWQMSHQ